jgi:hypothetical protein
MKKEEFANNCKEKLLLAISWIFENLQEFYIHNNKISNFNKQDLAKIKPLSELVMTTWLLKRCKIDLQILDKILEWSWKVTDYGDLLNALLLARNDFLPSCAMYSYFHQLGFKSKTLYKTIKRLSEMDATYALPLQPWAMLAMKYNLWKLNLLPYNRVSGLNLYIELLPEPWIISNEIGYAITHEVFYLTDFGFKKIANTQLADYLKIWSPYWANKFSEEKDFDLVSEFSMVWNCLNSKGEMPWYDNPLIRVLEFQNEDGSIEGPDGAGSFLFSNTDSKHRRLFLKRYHTTLVFIMANALSLKSIYEQTTLNIGLPKITG